MYSSNYSLDVVLVPLSLFLIAGYHAYIWQSSKSKHPVTTIGLDMMRGRAWLRRILAADDKMAMLGLQSIRNSLMSAILSASIAVVLNASLAALINNTYKSGHLLQSVVGGSQEGSLLILKFASTSLLLLFSFLCSSVAVGFIIEANFLISVSDELLFAEHAMKMFDRGSVLAVVGNRVLQVALLFLLWMLGPVPLFISSVGLVCALYSLDFPSTH